MKASVKTIQRSKFVGLESISFILRPIQTSLISLLIIRLFDVELWGQFVVFLVAVEFLLTFMNWGQKPFLSREFPQQPKEIGINWGKAGIARIPLLLFAIVILYIIPDFRTYFLPLLLWTVFRWLSFLFEAVVQFYRKYIWLIGAEITSIFVSLGSIFLFFKEMNLENLILVFAFSAMSKFIILTPLLKEWRFSNISIAEIKNGLMLSFPFFALSIVGLIQTKGDLYVATYLLPKNQLAAYQVMIGFLFLGQTFSSIVLGPFQKNIYRWQGNDFSKLKRFYLKIGLMSTVLLSIIIYFGLEYIYLIDLQVIHLLLFFIYLFILYSYLIESHVLLKYKNEKQLLQYNLIAAVSNIVIAFILVSWYGIIGALISGIACRLILAILIVKRSKKILNGKSS